MSKLPLNKPQAIAFKFFPLPTFITTLSLSLCISSQKGTMYNAFPFCSAVAELNDSSKEDLTSLALPASQPLPQEKLGEGAETKQTVILAGGQ